MTPRTLTCWLLLTCAAHGQALFLGITPTEVPTNKVVPVVSGDPEAGSILSCTTGTWAKLAKGYTYQWQADEVNIVGANSSTFNTAGREADESITCLVAALNAAGTATAVRSNAIVITVTSQAPVNTVAPEVTGSFLIGETLTCDTGSWTNEPTGYTYQWERDGSAIEGETSSTYVTTGSAGDSITCDVTATNAQGSNTATSNAVVLADTLRPALFGSIPSEATSAGFAPNDLSTSVRTDVTPTERAAVIQIAAGNYDTPYAASTANRTYRLLGDVIFEGCGIRISASNVTVDLNGYTLTYHNVAPSDEETATVSSSGGGGGSAYPTLDPSGLTLTANSHAYCVVEFTSGAENGNFYEVRSNTTTTLTMENHNNISDDSADIQSWQNGGPSASDTFRIYDPRRTFGVGVLPYTYPGGTIEVVNGTIVEGAGYGRGCNYAYDSGCNPIQYLDGGTAWTIGGVAATWDAPNCNGFNLRGSVGSTVKYCELTDNGTLVTNRQRVAAAVITNATGTLQYNRIHSCRQQGIGGGAGTTVEYNEIRGTSHATNSAGTGCGGSNSIVRYNNIYMTGQHPIGIGSTFNVTGADVHHNWVESETTIESPEYGWNYACGLTIRWGVRASSNSYHDNCFITYADNTNQKSRTVFLGDLDEATSEIIENNFIGAYSHDDATECHCINGAESSVLVQNNTLVSSHNIYWLSDGYWNPQGIRYVNNTTYQSGSDPAFATFFLGTYNAEEADFISGTYGTGTAVDDFSGSSDAETIMRFGWNLTVTVTDGGNPVEGAAVVVKDKDSNVLRTGYTTDVNGEVVVDVPTYYRQGPTISTTNTLMPLTVEASYSALSGSNTISPTSDDTITVAIE